MSQQSFAELGVSKRVQAALKTGGFREPFAIQTKVIGDVLAGRDVLAKSPTGSGKTLAFMIPLADITPADAGRPAALVLAPTRELVTQIVEAGRPLLAARGLRVAAVYGGVGLEKQAREAAAAHVLVATPGRLEDLLGRRAFTLDEVRTLVLDEADRMLDMGFRPVVDRIVSRCPVERQTLFFSATLDGEVGRLAARYTDDAVLREHVPPPAAVPDIEHRFVRVESDDRVERLAAEVGAGEELTIVFVRTKHGADRLVRRLARVDVPAAAMHGDKSQRQRERALADFERGRVRTLVATDVAARGIHVDNIAKVVNFDPPGAAEDYVHRTGRTGRAGERGVAVTFVGREHLSDMRTMARRLKLDEELAAVTAGDPPEPVRTVRPARSRRGGGPSRPQARPPAAATGAAGRRPRRRRAASPASA